MSSICATRRASPASRTEQQPCLCDLGAALNDGEVAPAEAGPPRERLRASLASLTSQTSSFSCTPSGVPRRMKQPMTSYPSRFNNAAATELSTPPDMATTTFLPEDDIGGTFYAISARSSGLPLRL